MNHVQVCDRFNSLFWHDSKLTGMEVIRREELNRDDAVLRLQMWRAKGQPLQRARLLLKNAAILSLNIDLDGKRLCADDIATGFCSQSSAWFDELKKAMPYEEKPLEGYLHFSIRLIPPGGEINVAAVDFDLAWG